MERKNFILITEPELYSKKAIDIYSKMGRIIFPTDKSDLYEICSTRGHNILGIVIRLNYYIDEKFLSNFLNLKFIASPTTGMTHIDMQYLSNAGIKLYTLNNCKDKIKNVSSTTELTIGLIINLMRHIPPYIHEVKENHKWNRDKFSSNQLRGKKIGLVGLGRIGKGISSICNLFGMSVIAFDPNIKKEDFKECNAKPVDFNTLIKESDIISIHASYTKENYQLFNTKELNMMKKGSYLINTSRGEFINEKELALLIEKGHISGCSLDVLDNELVAKNNLKNHPLIKLAKKGYNVLITPHIGGCTYEAMRETEEILALHVSNELEYN